jgi:hypothetical protein
MVRNKAFVVVHYVRKVGRKVIFDDEISPTRIPSGAFYALRETKNETSDPADTWLTKA